MVIPFLAQEISGLATQAYNSGAVNRKFINDVSGAIWNEMATIEGSIEDTPDNWTTLTGGVGLATFEGAIGVSGSTPVSLDVAGYATISSQAREGALFSANAYTKSEVDDISGAIVTHVANKYWDIDNDTAVPSDGDTTHISTADQVYDYVQTVSSNLRTDINAIDDTPTTWGVLSAGTGVAPLTSVGVSGSGETVEVLGYATISSQAQKAYASANALNNSAFLKVASGWQSVADDATVTHGLGTKPTSIIIQPSGPITFATGYDTVTTTTFHARISAPGSRVINWRAEV